MSPVLDPSRTATAVLSVGPGQILMADAAFAGLVGLGGDARGHSLRDLVHAGPDAAEPEGLAAVLDGRAGWTAGEALFGVDDDVRRLRFSASRMVTPDGDGSDGIVLRVSAEAAAGDPSASDGVTPSAAAAALGVSSSTLRRWIDEGRLRAHRTGGGHRRIPASEVRRLAREARPAVRMREHALPAASLPALATVLDAHAARLVELALRTTYEPGAIGWFSEPGARTTVVSHLATVAAACRSGRFDGVVASAERLYAEARLGASLLECQTFADRLWSGAARELAAHAEGRAELADAQRLMATLRRTLIRMEDRRS